MLRVDQGDILALLLDEDGPRRPPAQRLQAERAGAGEEVDHGRSATTSPRMLNIDSRTRSLVGRVPPPRPVDLVAPPLAGDDPHGPTLPSVRPSAGDRDRRLDTPSHLTNPKGKTTVAHVAADAGRSEVDPIG